VREAGGTGARSGRRVVPSASEPVGDPLVLALAEAIRGAVRNTNHVADHALANGVAVLVPCTCAVDVGRDRCVRGRSNAPRGVYLTHHREGDSQMRRSSRSTMACSLAFARRSPTGRRHPTQAPPGPCQDATARRVEGVSEEERRARIDECRNSLTPSISEEERGVRHARPCAAHRPLSLRPMEDLVLEIDELGGASDAVGSHPCRGMSSIERRVVGGPLRRRQLEQLARLEIGKVREKGGEFRRASHVQPPGSGSLDRQRHLQQVSGNPSPLRTMQRRCLDLRDPSQSVSQPCRHDNPAGGNGRFKSSRPDDLRGPTERVGDPLGQHDRMRLVRTSTSDMLAMSSAETITSWRRPVTATRSPWKMSSASDPSTSCATPRRRLSLEVTGVP
jgi:hypothetical protein